MTASSAPSGASRALPRIVLASMGAVALIAAALVVTVWSYRGAVTARQHAQDAALENAGAHKADTYLWREREAINEYLLAPGPDTIREVRRLRASFRGSVAGLELDETRERRLVLRARAANERLMRMFLTGAQRATRTERSRLAFVGALDRAGDSVTAPLDDLKRLNVADAAKREKDADAESRRALLAGVIAGGLAILGGIGFALYAFRLLQRISRQNERLRELDRMKEDFVSSVSHELRTPLTSIQGYLDLVLDGEAGELTAEQERFLTIVRRNSDRLLRVVGDLLFVAQADAGTIALEPGSFDLSSVLAEAVEAARPAAVDKNIELSLDAGTLPTLVGDRSRIAQVVDNLVSNAVKFTPEGGRVSVRATADEEEDEAVIEVADTGMGISPEDQRQLFQRFFRTAAASDQAIQGTGLGLAIVHAIVDAHGGSISVDSEVGRGTTFRVRLPLEREPAVA
jgi:signal transduction histidine kinase